MEESNNSNKEVCANNLSSPLSRFIFVQNPERKEVCGDFRQTFVWRSLFDSCIRNGYKDGNVITIKKNEKLMDHNHWNTVRPVLLKAFGKTWSTTFLREYWIQLVEEGSSKEKSSILYGSQKFLRLTLEQ